MLFCFQFEFFLTFFITQTPQLFLGNLPSEGERDATEQSRFPE